MTRRTLSAVPPQRACCPAAVFTPTDIAAGVPDVPMGLLFAAAARIFNTLGLIKAS